MCGWVSVINFEKLLAISSSNISFALFFSSPSGIVITHMSYLLKLWFLGVLFFLLNSFFSLHLSLGSFYLNTFKLTDSCL